MSLPPSKPACQCNYTASTDCQSRRSLGRGCKKQFDVIRPAWVQKNGSDFCVVSKRN